MQSFCFRGACSLGMVEGNQRWITRDSKTIPASDRCREGSNHVDERVLRWGNGDDVRDRGSGVASQSNYIWAETWTSRRLRQAKTWEMKVQARGKYWGDNGLRVQGARAERWDEVRDGPHLVAWLEFRFILSAEGSHWRDLIRRVVPSAESQEDHAVCGAWVVERKGRSRRPN